MALLDRVLAEYENIDYWQINDDNELCVLGQLLFDAGGELPRLDALQHLSRAGYQRARLDCRHAEDKARATGAGGENKKGLVIVSRLR